MCLRWERRKGQGGGGKEGSPSSLMPPSLTLDVRKGGGKKRKGEKGKEGW